jgi:membrane-bound lytic murein transglycosylase A
MQSNYYKHLKSIRIHQNIFLLLTSVLLFTGCSINNSQYQNLNDISQGNFKKAQWTELKEFESDDLDEAFMVFKKGCQSSKNSLQKLCELAKDTNNSKSFFINNFEPYKLYDNSNNDKGLITGYFEPLLYGSREKIEKYKYPIYKTPKDLVVIDLKQFSSELPKKKLIGKVVENQFIPYDTREEITKREDLEPICYVDNKIDLFFLHIQGSGRVQLDTNETINIGYSGQNGRDYFAIGKQLVANGEIKKEEISLQTIRKWLESYPDKNEEILNLNKSYIFFEESNTSASGSLGVELVEKRNIAVDTSIIPLGYPVFLKTTNPITKEKINRLVVAADTGGAIKGEIRADFFFGFGKKAEELAGIMKEEGEMYIFIPKK